MLSTICGFKILSYVYTIKQEQLKTNNMKTQVFKASEPKEIIYRITIQDGALVDTFDYSFKRIFFNNNAEGDDWEFIYSMQSFYWEQMMKMELNESIYFKPDRSDDNSKGIIVRVM